LLVRADSIEPNNATIISAIGNIYFHIARVDTAIVLFRKAISIDSNYRGAYLNYGTALNYKKSYTDAISILLRGNAIRKDTDDSYAFYGTIAWSYFYLGKCSEAKLYITKADQASLQKSKTVRASIENLSVLIRDSCQSK